MTTISYEMPPSIFSALRLSPKEFTREMRTAACVQWYAQGLISQGKAAEIAGLGRAEFIEELSRREVPTCQATFAELVEEERRRVKLGEKIEEGLGELDRGEGLPGDQVFEALREKSRRRRREAS